MRLIARMAAQFGVTLPVFSVFKFPTIRELAETLRSRQAPARAEVPPQTPQYEEGFL
jgi:hypothetical protein